MRWTIRNQLWGWMGCH